MANNQTSANAIFFHNLHRNEFSHKNMKTNFNEETIETRRRLVVKPQIQFEQIE